MHYCYSKFLNRFDPQDLWMFDIFLTIPSKSSLLASLHSHKLISMQFAEDNLSCFPVDTLDYFIALVETLSDEDINSLYKELPYEFYDIDDYPKKSAAEFAYEKNNRFLTANEKLMFKNLCDRLPSTFTLMAKVRLSDLFSVKKTMPEPLPLLRMIQAKHVDFVIIDSETLEPVLLVELDDSSHDNEEREKRDSFINQLSEACKLPIQRICTSNSEYEFDSHVTTIMHRLYPPCPWCENHLSDDGICKMPDCANYGKNTVCPECGKLLTRRQSTKSDIKFVGCTGYPDCKYKNFSIG